MLRFMDFHEDLKLPQEAIDQIAQGTREGATDEFAACGRRSKFTTTLTARFIVSWKALMRTRSASITRRWASPAATCTG